MAYLTLLNLRRADNVLTSLSSDDECNAIGKLNFLFASGVDDGFVSVEPDAAGADDGPLFAFKNASGKSI